MIPLLRFPLRQHASLLVRGLFLAVSGGGPLLPPLVAADPGNAGIIAVYASASPDYVRTPGPNGSFKVETYAFGEGGHLGGNRSDDTIDRLRFLDVARTIAPALAARNYQPCNTAEPRQANLLIMVYWGTTVATDRTSSEAGYQIASTLVPPPLHQMSPPPNGLGGTAMVSDPSTSGRGSEGAARAAAQAANDASLQQSLTLTSMANRQRDRQDFENAMILGYLPELQQVQTYEMTALNQRRQDLVDEIEDGRYYVVLMAYDFQTLLLHRQRKLLWETRFSLRQRQVDFGKQLAAMAESASRYFGRNSHGLERMPLPEGHVGFGDLKVLGYEPPKN